MISILFTSKLHVDRHCEHLRLRARDRKRQNKYYYVYNNCRPRRERPTRTTHNMQSWHAERASRASDVTTPKVQTCEILASVRRTESRPRSACSVRVGSHCCMLLLPSLTTQPKRSARLACFVYTTFVLRLYVNCFVYIRRTSSSTQRPNV